MELRRLRYFVAVAERQNFTAAARQLGIAQPPLSVQIQKLEAELGCPLFLRQHRRVELTPAGHTLLAEAREILAHADGAILRIQDEVAGRSGELVLDCSDGAFSETVTKRLRKFLRKHRGLRVTTRRIGSGASSRADGVICEFPADALPAGAIPLEHSQVQAALPPKHRLCERADFLPADLIGETLIVLPFEQRSAVEQVAFRGIEAAGVRVALSSAAGTLHERFWQISLGQGLGFCTSVDRGSLDVQRVPLAEPSIGIVTAFVPNAASRSAALPALIEAIRA